MRSEQSHTVQSVSEAMVLTLRDSRVFDRFECVHTCKHNHTQFPQPARNYTSLTTTHPVIRWLTLSLRLGSAPLERSSSTTELCPFLAANIKGVLLNCVMEWHTQNEYTHYISLHPQVMSWWLTDSTLTLLFCALTLAWAVIKVSTTFKWPLSQAISNAVAPCCTQDTLIG